jgi:hypothetical protein
MGKFLIIIPNPKLGIISFPGQTKFMQKDLINNNLFILNLILNITINKEIITNKPVYLLETLYNRPNDYHFRRKATGSICLLSGFDRIITRQ